MLNAVDTISLSIVEYVGRLGLGVPLPPGGRTNGPKKINFLNDSS